MAQVHFAPCTPAWLQFMETLWEYMENGIIDDVNDKTTVPLASHFLAQPA